jgi:hypothetical protein
VTHQAVHELRHKKHATTLHRSARTLCSGRVASTSSATTRSPATGCRTHHST